MYPWATFITSFASGWGMWLCVWLTHWSHNNLAMEWLFLRADIPLQSRVDHLPRTPRETMHFSWTPSEHVHCSPHERYSHCQGKVLWLLWWSFACQVSTFTMLMVACHHRGTPNRLYVWRSRFLSLALASREGIARRLLCLHLMPNW